MDSGTLESMSLKSRFRRGLPWAPSTVAPVPPACARERCMDSSFIHSKTNWWCSLRERQRERKIEREERGRGRGERERRERARDSESQ